MAIPDIIDVKNHTLVEAVNEQLKISSFSAMCVGYFQLSGFEQIQKNLTKGAKTKMINPTKDDIGRFVTYIPTNGVAGRTTIMPICGGWDSFRDMTRLWDTAMVVSL